LKLKVAMGVSLNFPEERYLGPWLDLLLQPGAVTPAHAGMAATAPTAAQPAPEHPNPRRG